MLCIQMYERLSKLKSPNGVTVDKCIQPSVDNKGDIIGLVAGDPECFEVHPCHTGITVISKKML